MKSLKRVALTIALVALGSSIGFGTAYGYGGHHPNNNRSSGGGEVLGASTGPDSCSPLITVYLREGKVNDVEQVKALQTFLNKEMNSGLPVTGFFGSLTTAAVKAFQTKYASEVLAPWGLTQPTGYVYKLTQWKINNINCGTTTPAPIL